ncbi:MAG: hypothetical protein AAGG38_09575, partial [Planctomycetota bacterium]
MDKVKPVWVVGFVGNRPGPGAGRSAEALRACRPALESVLKRLMEQAASRGGGTIELVIGAAAGADLEAADAAEALGLPVHVILPMPEARFWEDFDGGMEEDRARAQRRVEAARAGERGGSLRIADGDTRRPDCYHDTNLQLIEASDLLVTLYADEAGPPKRGGTAEAVGQAQGMGVALVRIDPAAGGEVAWPEDIASWPEPDGVYEDLLHHGSEWAEAAERGGTESVLGALDGRAMRMKGSFTSRVYLSIVLHLVAALLAVVTAVFFAGKPHAPEDGGHHTVLTNGHAEDPATHHGSAETHAEVNAEEHHNWKHDLAVGLTGVEFLLVTVALGVALRLQFGGAHHCWRDTRFAAEVVRGVRAAG